jgi:hypothetical protein
MGSTIIIYWYPGSTIDQTSSDHLNAIGKYFEHWKRITGPGTLLSAVQFHFESGLRPCRLRLGRPTRPISSACAPWRRFDRASKPTASATSRPRQLPPGLPAQHMQTPPMCTALRLTRCPYLLDAEAKPRLPSHLPRNTSPLPSPVHAPPLYIDNVCRDQIIAQEHHLPIAEPCSPLATSPSSRGLKATDATFFICRRAPHRGPAALATGCLRRCLPELPVDTAHPF